jgi:hypothetical protein
MKKLILLLAGCLFLFSIHSFRKAEKKFADVLSQLGVSQDDANTYIWTSFLYQHFQYPTTNAIKSLTSPKRADVCKELATYTKKYLSSAEFKKLYAQRREVEKPQAPPFVPDPNQMMNDQAERIRNQIKQQEHMKATPSTNEKANANIDRNITRLQDQLKSYTDSTHPKYAVNKKPFLDMRDAVMGEYDKKMELFKKQYPANPNEMIRDRLQKFLVLSDEVDFNAELQPGPGGFKIFANPEYEKKSKDWKACYRAGKEAITVVRAEAQKLLKELK